MNDQGDHSNISSKSVSFEPGGAVSISMPLEKVRSRNTSSPRLSAFSISILSLSLLWCVFWFIHSWNYWEDDAFIHLEFARSFASGHGFAFNGRVVYGDTSPLWVFLLCGMHLLVPGWMVAGKLLAVLGVLFALAGVYVFSRRLTGHNPNSKRFSVAMVLLFVLNPYFCYWSFSGMETVTAAGLALFGAVAATSDTPSWRTFFLGCFLAGVAPLLRPEMVFLAGILSLLLFYQWSRIPGSISSLQKQGGFVVGLILAAGPTALWAIYALHVFGRIVPNTNAAKRAGPGASVLLRLLNVYSLGFPLILGGLVAGLFYLLLRYSTVRNRLASLKPLASPVTTGGVFIVWSLIAAFFYVTNHTYVQTRYIMVSAAGLVIVVLAIMQSLSLKTYRLCLSGALVFALAISSFSVWPFVRNKAISDGIVAELASFIKLQLPADAAIADYSIGEMAFLCGRTVVDTGGITRPGAIPFLNSPPADMLRWIHSQGATYYLVDNKPEPGAVLVFEKPLPFIGWSLKPRHYSEWGQIRLWKLAPSGQQTLSRATP